MKVTFIPMTREYAERIVSTWKYPGEYSPYDYINEADNMLNESVWGEEIFAALDESGELVGELTVNFRDENTDYTGNRGDIM